MRYSKLMGQKIETLDSQAVSDAKKRREIAAHLQHIEVSPATPEQIAMFERFEREGWSHERRLAFIRERAKAGAAH